MPAYQFYDPAPVFFDLLGIQPLANGTVSFYEVGTAIERTTWSDSGLTTPNQNPVPLGPDGRATDPIFCDGNYTVVARNNLGATIWTRDIIGGGASATVIPPLAAGFLTNNGTSLQWQDIALLPDPTGSTSHYLTTDGANWILQPIPTPPTIPDPEIVLTASSLRAGQSNNTTKFFMQAGDATAPASGTNRTSIDITFPVAFSVPPAHVSITVKTTTITGNSLVAHAVTAITATGFTVTFDTADRHFVSGTYITNPIPFSYMAFGNVVVP